MTSFVGEYTAKVDQKGRIAFPAALRKQCQGSDSDRYVLRRDLYEQCLVLYPMDEWQRQTELLRSKINPYDRRHARFLRGFFRGTAELMLDAQGRMLLPKPLIEFAAIDREVYLAGIDTKIEIWSRELYDALEAEMEDFAEMAQDILGNEML